MSDSDSDDWGREELVIVSNSKLVDGDDNDIRNDGDGGDDYWEEEKTEMEKPKVEQRQQQSGINNEEGESMIIVDLTQINADVHSKFDRNSVNDPETASALRKNIEDNYQQHALSSELLANSTVIPCGSTVWRDALIQLRTERPGHYFVPVFWAKKK